MTRLHSLEEKLEAVNSELRAESITSLLSKIYRLSSDVEYIDSSSKHYHGFTRCMNKVLMPEMDLMFDLLHEWKHKEQSHRIRADRHLAALQRKKLRNRLVEHAMVLRDAVAEADFPPPNVTRYQIIDSDGIAPRVQRLPHFRGHDRRNSGVAS